MNVETQLEKVEITDEHLRAIRGKWDCEEMDDNTIVQAMLRYEKRFVNGSVYILEMICFPDFQSYLNFYKNRA